MTDIAAKLAQVVAIARSGSFSKAAEELHLSQPALSRSIAALERDYGVTLFDRSPRGVVPTVSGRQIAADAEILLRSIRTFEHNSKMLGSGEAGRLAIGVGPLAAAILVPGVITAMMRKRPSVSLEISTRGPEAMLEQLLRDEIELFLFAGGQVETPADVEARELGRARVRLLVRSGHPLAGKPSVTITELARFPLASGTGLPAERILSMPIAIRCDNYHLLREVTLGSDAVWLSASQMCQEDIEAGRLNIVEIIGMAPMWSDITLFVRSGRVMTPLAMQFVGLCVDHLHHVDTQ